MTDERKPHPSPAAAYVFLVPLLAVVARRHGYALAVHGSMQRDLDLVAVPWTDEAAPAAELISAFHLALGFTMEHDAAVRGPVEKPHGRRAWSIPLECGPWLDISVIPRLNPQHPPP